MSPLLLNYPNLLKNGKYTDIGRHKLNNPDVVMKINSIEAGGRTMLKKCVLESTIDHGTISHSGVALMKKRESGGSKSVVILF